jgi:acyl-CoA thioesterase-1
MMRPTVTHGDTTANALPRLDNALADHPDIVILELGANDALRGVDPAVTRTIWPQ